jgi:hypothetical protein
MQAGVTKIAKKILYLILEKDKRCGPIKIP